jgi:hypothetical protein
VFPQKRTSAIAFLSRVAFFEIWKPEQSNKVPTVVNKRFVSDNVRFKLGETDFGVIEVEMRIGMITYGVTGAVPSCDEASPGIAICPLAGDKQDGLNPVLCECPQDAFVNFLPNQTSGGIGSGVIERECNFRALVLGKECCALQDRDKERCAFNQVSTVHDWFVLRVVVPAKYRPIARSPDGTLAPSICSVA